MFCALLKNVMKFEGVQDRADGSQTSFFSATSRERGADVAHPFGDMATAVAVVTQIQP